MVTCTQQLPQGIPATTPVYTTVNAIQQPEDPPNSALNAPITSAPPSPAVYGAVSMPNPRGIKIPRPSDILDYSDGPTTFGPRALWTQPSDAEVDHYAIGPSPPAHGRSDAAEYHIYDQFEDEEYDAEYEDAQYEYDYYEQQLGENEEEHVEHDADQSYYGDHEYDDHEDEDKDVVYDEEDKENHPTAEQFAECHMITPQPRRLFGHNERVIGRRIGRTYDSIEPSPTMVERAIALGVFLAPKVKRRAGRFECKRDHTTDPPAEARICNFFDNCWGERQPIVGLGSMRGRWILDEPEDEAEDAEGRVDKIRRVGRGPHWSKLVHAVESTPSSLNSPSSSGLPQLSFSCSTLDSSMSSSFVDENPPWSLSRENSIADDRVNKHQLLPPSLRSSNVQTVQEADEQDVLAE
ncbi:hypothetical protein BG000_005433 [Podila horticola]|nr:hypothetical protein BG000_005433 [Podila horticola]